MIAIACAPDWREEEQHRAGNCSWTKWAQVSPGAHERAYVDPVTAPDWQALGDAVRDRRADLGFRQADIEQHGGPGVGTVRNVERASRTSYSRGTLRQLERALQWPPGHVDRVLSGLPADPVPVPVDDRHTASVIHDRTTAEAIDDAHALRVGRLVIALWRELAAVEDGAGRPLDPSRLVAPVDKVTIPWHS